jgi:hypothetical protein
MKNLATGMSAKFLYKVQILIKLRMFQVCKKLLGPKTANLQNATLADCPLTNKLFKSAILQT